MTTLERRFTRLPVETRAARGESRTIGGYAAVFNRNSENLGGFVEVVDARAFPERRLLGVKLVDVAPVNVPAYPDASVGLRSLAERFDADVAEVRSLAEQNELRKFFVTTERQAPLTSGAHARLELLQKRQPRL